MLLTEYDYATDIAVQREESEAIGFDRGKKNGLAEGAYQAKLETARRMRLENLGIDLITKITGLSEAEIADLETGESVFL